MKIYHKLKSFLISFFVIIISSNNMYAYSINKTNIDKTDVECTYELYKPGTNYVHKKNCHWVDDTCYEIVKPISNVKICKECHFTNSYNTQNTTTFSDNDFTYLCRIVYHEAGSSWISEYDKSKVVAVVMNRVNSSVYPNTVYDVLTAPYQFSGFNINTDVSNNVGYDSCINAVNLYFSNPDSYGKIYSFWGDGTANYFY